MSALRPHNTGLQNVMPNEGSAEDNLPVITRPHNNSSLIQQKPVPLNQPQPDQSQDNKPLQGGAMFIKGVPNPLNLRTDNKLRIDSAF